MYYVDLGGGGRDHGQGNCGAKKTRLVQKTTQFLYCVKHLFSAKSPVGEETLIWFAN